MYFDFEGIRPEAGLVGRAMSWREGMLISIIVHMTTIVLLLLAPRLFPGVSPEARQRSSTCTGCGDRWVIRAASSADSGRARCTAVCCGTMGRFNSSRISCMLLTSFAPCWMSRLMPALARLLIFPGTA